MDIEKIIERVLITLNAVEVRGKSNMDKLLGCINALETVQDALPGLTASAPAQEVEEHGE